MKVVFTFGRFNPPTIGHEKLIKKVADVASGGDFFIYASYTQNSAKDPLVPTISPYTVGSNLKLVIGLLPLNLLNSSR